LAVKVIQQADRPLLLTDVASTKSDIVEQIERKIRQKRSPVRFVGGHPMAGSENKGPKYARADLFDASHCFVMKDTPAWALRRCGLFWKSLGSKVFFVGSREHDRIAAKVSHLPHLMSTALVLAATRRDPENDLRYAGPGLKGLLRIAGANPGMWADIFATNREPVRKELKKLIRELELFDRLLARKDNRRLLRMLNLSRILKEV